MIGTIQPENGATLALAMRQVNAGEFLSSCMSYVANYSIGPHCCRISVMLKLEHQLVYIYLTGYSISSLATWDHKKQNNRGKTMIMLHIAVQLPPESRSHETEQVPQ